MDGENRRDSYLLVTASVWTSRLGSRYGKRATCLLSLLSFRRGGWGQGGLGSKPFPPCISEPDPGVATGSSVYDILNPTTARAGRVEQNRDSHALRQRRNTEGMRRCQRAWIRQEGT